MKNLSIYELCNIAGGVNMDNFGDNIVISLSAEEALQLNNCLFTWKCVYSYGANDRHQLKSGEAYHGYYIAHSINPNAIAQYTLTPVK